MVAAALLSGLACASGPAEARWRVHRRPAPVVAPPEVIPLPPPRPPELTPKPAAPRSELPPPLPPPAPPAQVATPAPNPPACLARLTANGVAAEAAPPPPAPVQGCGVGDPVQLHAVGLADGATVRLPANPVVDCAFGLVFADYVRTLVAPLGTASLGSPVVSIDTGPAYQCRTRDHLPGAKLSAHGKGVAIDVMAVNFADKRRVAVDKPGGATEASFFRAMRTAACGWFTTVLGPGSDAFHADNLHLDIDKHGSSGSYRICQ